MFVEQILAALFVLALLGGSLWLLRRKGLASLNLTFPKRFSGARQMRIVERVSLTAHHSLHLVRIHNRTILIGVSPSGCNRIASFQDSSCEQKPGTDALS
jgi:flagellar biosynthetic protein FliO